MASLIFAMVLAVLIFILLIAALSACTAKAVTGKWPHQDAKSKRVYDAVFGVRGRHD